MIRRILNVNGFEKMVTVDPGASLAGVLRENLFLTGTKVGCGKGECGACSVIMNGKLIRSCIVKMEKVPDNAVITTIEGIGTPQVSTPCSMHGSSTTAPSVVFAPPDLLSLQRPFWMKTPTLLAKRCGTGSRRITTHVGAQAINRW